MSEFEAAYSRNWYRSDQCRSHDLVGRGGLGLAGYRLSYVVAMSNDLALQVITGIYVACNAVRLLSYLPQIAAVARERSGAHAISLVTWLFWTLSNAATAVYCSTVINDALLAGTMWGNAAGCFAVASLTVMKRQRYGWIRA